VEGSLRRLDTDYIDVLFTHNPDPQTPVLETLRTLDDLIRAGKVRYLGCSNFAAWQIADAVWTSRAYNLERFIAAGGRYNLLERDLERDVVPCCEALGVSVIPTVPLAAGFLTGKYRRGDQAHATRRLSHEEHQGNPSLAPSMRKRDLGDTLTDGNFDKLEKLEAFARERGHSVTELAIAWLLARPWLGTVIAGAMSPEQMALNAATVQWKLTPDEVKQIDGLTRA
jgi:aryl-alcohol dehydrogenase-like predicted oxidoreductase